MLCLNHYIGTYLIIYAIYYVKNALLRRQQEQHIKQRENGNQEIM